ncbi:TIM barrel protein [Microbacterium sp. NPDC089189]|uniref:TIM barrel protein n=1 Tax=Microbacterium sp. NPDC089189 TaxID=3154972 RepID=UPI00342EA572
MRFVANIDMQFVEEGPHESRLRAAAGAGFDAVEFWRWESVDLPALARAAQDHGVEIVAFVTDWSVPAAVPAERRRFVDAVRDAVDAAWALSATRVVTTLGTAPDGWSRDDVLSGVGEALGDAALATRGSGVTLLVEPLNTRVDHPGSAIATAADARDLLRRVDDPAVRMLFDVYHSVAQGERVADEIAASASFLDYVQIADAPGRHEPSTGGIDWADVARALAEARYDGPTGLEFFPSGTSAASLETARRTWERAAGSVR